MHCIQYIITRAENHFGFPVASKGWVMQFSSGNKICYSPIVFAYFNIAEWGDSGLLLMWNVWVGGYINVIFRCDEKPQFFSANMFFLISFLELKGYYVF